MYTKISVEVVVTNTMHDNYQIRDKVEIIPVHICPVCNLYDNAYLIKDGEVEQILSVLCGGKLQ